MNNETERVLVTGGTGLVGSGVVDKLLQKGYAVRVMGRRECPAWVENSDATYIKGDIRDASVVEKAVADAETVIHLAAKTGGDGAWRSFYEITVEATEQLFEIAKEHGGKRIVLISSMGNYAGVSMQDIMIVDEKVPLEQEPEKRPHYAHAKTLQDEFAQTQLNSDCLDVTIVRPGVVLSPEIDNPLLGAAFPINDHLVVLLDDGERDYQFIYLEDVAEGIVQVLETDQTVGEVYNLVHPEYTSRNEAVAAYQNAFDQDQSVVHLHLANTLPFFQLIDFLEMHLPGSRHYFAYQLSRYVTKVRWDCSKLQAHTGWAPEFSIQETYRELAND